MKTVAERLRYARHSYKGWTQGHLATVADVSQSTIGNIESGKRQGAGTLPKLAKAMGISHDWLAYNEGGMLDGNVIDVQGTFVEDRKSAIAIESGTQTPDAVEVISAALTQMSDEQREAMAGKLAALARAPDSPTLKKSISESLSSAGNGGAAPAVEHKDRPDFL